ncbi:recombinase family protein [Massilia sp. ST3]|uniref:recombinase family protein n=1 Tax=Massilia sp. ST3 TaxID=2824903 RepID=UPI001B821C50|nr:recombinase family protein [Massilia sp. ST3]MBQ5946410.1 recombinase family protein [Massilia sp. ST3]
MNKAYSYIRYSDPQQAKGDSYERQLRDTLAYCKANDLELVSDADYMYFDKGISGYSGKLRDDDTELSRFLSNVKDGSIPPGSTLIIESLDRLSREHVRTSLPRFMDILNAGVNIHTLHSNKTYSRNYDEMDLFQSILEMSRSHRESKWKAERVSARWQQKQEQALEGVPLGKTKPAWLDLEYTNGTDKKPTGFIRNDLQHIVKRIFQLTLDGYGRNMIARILNEEGIPAFKTKEGWGASTINQILNNKAVLGIYQPHTKDENGKRVPRGEPNPNYYPAIIDRDTFERARAAVTSRDAAKARKQTPDYQIWQGIARCALCGSPLHSYGNGRKPKEGESPARWMRCYNAKKGKCTAGSIAVARTEQVFKQILAKLNVLALVKSSANAINTKLEVVTGQLVAERAKLADFKRDYAAKRSLTVLDLVIETEAVIEALVKQEQTLTSDLAADQIIDKEEFFAKLDLHSFPGRSRANSILKRLTVQVDIDTAENRYRVFKDGEPVFEIVDHGTGYYYQPGNSELSGVIQRQEGTFTPYFVVDRNAYEEPDAEFESEGHDVRDGY